MYCYELFKHVLEQLLLCNRVPTFPYLKLRSVLLTQFNNDCTWNIILNFYLNDIAVVFIYLASFQLTITHCFFCIIAINSMALLHSECAIIIIFFISLYFCLCKCLFWLSLGLLYQGMLNFPHSTALAPLYISWNTRMFENIHTPDKSSIILSPISHQCYIVCFE